MFTVNTKLWSFLSGCFIANSFVWIIDFAQSAPMINALSEKPSWLLTYYPEEIMVISSIIFTSFSLFLMKKLFNITANDHSFWLIIPTLITIVLTILSANIMIIPMLAASLPTVSIIVFIALKHRFSKSTLSAKSFDQSSNNTATI